jgi:hypothetical protein
MRTTGRIPDLRLEERSYDAVKIWGQGESRTDLALPVTIQNAPSVTINNANNTLVTPLGWINATYSSTPYKLICAASVNNTLVSTGLRALMGLHISNDTASKIYVKMYNKATAPVAGTDVPVEVFMVPANSFRDIDSGFFHGVGYALGLGFATTGLQADNDTTAVAAGVTITVRYK